MTKSDETRFHNFSANRESVTLNHDESNPLRRLQGLRDKEAKESLDDTVQRAREGIADSKRVIAQSRDMLNRAKAFPTMGR